MPRSIHRLLTGGIVLILLSAVAGCTPEPAPKPEVKKFVERTRRDFRTLKNRLLPLLVQTDRSRKVDEVVHGFLNDADAMAGRSNLGIAVLDENMNYIAGRSISAEQPDTAPIQTSLRDFSYLKDLFQAAGDGITHRSLYYQGREIFTVCSAIHRGEQASAYVCLFYDAEQFRRGFGFGRKVFAGVDFSK